MVGKNIKSEFLEVFIIFALLIPFIALIFFTGIDSLLLLIPFIIGIIAPLIVKNKPLPLIIFLFLYLILQFIFINNRFALNEIIIILPLILIYFFLGYLLSIKMKTFVLFFKSLKNSHEKKIVIFLLIFSMILVLGVIPLSMIFQYKINLIIAYICFSLIILGVIVLFLKKRG